MVVTESIISAIIEEMTKRILSKVSQGKKLTDVEALTLMVTERFKTIEDKLERELKGMNERLERELEIVKEKLDTLENRLDVTEDIAKLKIELTELKSKL